MIVPAILEYLDGEGTEVADDTLAMFMPRLRRTLSRNLGVKGHGKRRVLSASMPWYCPRRCYYDLTGNPGEMVAGRSRLAFLLGDIYQVAVDIAAEQAGVTFKYPDESGEELELEWEVGGHKLVAHIDHALEVDGKGLVPVDSKSMATYTHGDFRKAAVDASAPWWRKEQWSYVAQLRFYMWGIEVLGLGTGEVGYFIGVDKNSGALAQVEVLRDPAVIEVFKRAVPYLAGRVAMFDAAAKGDPSTPRTDATGLPPRPAWANEVFLKGANKRADGTKGPVMEVDADKERTGDQGWRCGYCRHRFDCWPGSKTVVVGGKPKLRRAVDKDGEPV